MTRAQIMGILACAFAGMHCGSAAALTVNDLAQHSEKFQAGYYVAIYDALVTEVKISGCVEKLGPAGMTQLLRAKLDRASQRDRQVLRDQNVTLLVRFSVEEYCAASLPKP